jgi:hypothetical protein
MGDRSPVGRRDALRHRKLLTDKAREVVAEQGLEPARGNRPAGVGNATLYRHFPTRAAPRSSRRSSGMRCRRPQQQAKGARTAGDAWTGLTQYLRTVFASLATDRGTNDLMTTNRTWKASLR